MGKLLIINPGSTSTKIAIFDGENELYRKNILHSFEEISSFNNVSEQNIYRKSIILQTLKSISFDLKTLTAIVGRGGLLKPIPSGTYRVNKALLNDLKIGIGGQHASNLGGIIANDIAIELNVPAYIVDPVVVDEMEEVARITGIPEVKRKSKFHALNQKAVARRYCEESGKKYDKINLIVIHLGGGVSIGAHRNGKVIDVNNALDGDGPFSPERSGGVPAGELVNLCFSGKYSKEQIYKKIVGQGGFVAYLNTNDAREVRALVEKRDKYAIEIYNAFVYQIVKAIGEMAAVLEGKVDRIIITGGIAHWTELIKEISSKVIWISETTVYAGEEEMLALAQGANRIIEGQEIEKEYI